MEFTIMVIVAFLISGPLAYWGAQAILKNYQTGGISDVGVTNGRAGRIGAYDVTSVRIIRIGYGTI